MAVDGSLDFDTGIDTDGFERDAKDLKEAADACAKAVEETGKRVYDTFNKSGKMMTLERQISQTEEKIRSLKAEMGRMEAAKIPTEEYRELSDLVEKTQMRLDRLLERQEKMAEMGVKENSKSWKSLQYDIDATSHKLKIYQEELQDTIDRERAFISGSQTEAYQKKSAQLSGLNEKLYEQKKRLIDLIETEKKEQVDIPIKLNSGLFREQKERLKQELKELETGGASFGNADYDLKYATLQRVIVAENAYKRSLMEVDAGQKKAKQSTDQLTKSLDKSGKSAKKTGKRMSMLRMLGGAMLISFAMQAVMAVGNAVKEGMQNLAQYSNHANQTLSSFMSSLTYLKNSLAAGFAPVLNYVVPALNMLIDAIAQAIAWISQLFAILGGSSTFIRAKKTQEDYAKSLKKTSGAADDAKKSLAGFDQLTVLNDQNSSGGAGSSGTDPSEMFETVAVDSTLATVVDSIKARLQELQSIFADGFWDGLGDPSVFDSIQTHLSGIKQSLFEIFSDGQVSAAAENMVNQFVYALGQIIGSILSIGLTIADNLLGGFDLYLAQNKDRLKTQLIELFNIGADISKAVGDWFDILADIFSVFRSDSAKQITADLINIFSDAVFGIVDLIGSFLSDTLETVVGTVGDRKEEIKGLLSEVIQSVQKLTGTVAELVAGFFDGLNAFYDKHQEKIQLVISLLTQMILNFIEIGILKFKYFVDSITAVIEMLMGVFDGLITFISGVLTGDWEKAWGGLKDIFRSIFNGIVDIAENAINFIIESLNAMHFDIPDWVPGIGGSDFGFDITPVRLPRLASGTVVPRQAGEFAAILGDNNREAEVVSPISTMKQAFIEAMRETGMNFGGGDIQLTVNLDGKVVYDAVVKRNQMTKKQTGKNPLLV